jgi:YHS domain-containing protein
MNVKYLATMALMGLMTVGLGNSLNASVPSHASTTESNQSQTVAQDVVATRHPAVYTENGVALDGQDVVAYFTQSAVVEGKQKYSYRWRGAQWLFSSAANRDLFAKNPEQYAPQYGGYCAKAAAGGVLATTIPTAWEVRDGKLYLNYSLDAQKEWKQDTATKIVKANANWPRILNNETLKR